MNMTASLDPGSETPLPPQNIEVEQALLGAVLVTRGALIRDLSGYLKPEHFVEDLHQRIYAAAGEMVAAGKVADAITIKGFLPADQVIAEGVNVAQYLVLLVQGACPPSAGRDYARIVVELYGRREIIRVAEEAIALARDCPVDTSVDDQIRHSTTRLSEVSEAVSERQTGATRGGLGAIAHQVFERASDMMAGKIERPPSSGLADLDRRLPQGGLAPGSLYILAGRTGMGKTMCAASIATNVASRGLGAMYFSLEVPAAEIAARAVCSRIRDCQSSYGDFLSGKASPMDMEQYDAVRRTAAQWPLHIDDTAGVGIADISILCERQAARMRRDGVPLSLVVIDHAGLVQATPETRHNKVDALGAIANSAKVMAKRLNTCVMLCAQINRSVEAQEDKRPSMAQIRASGEIEEAADAILLLYREAYYLARQKAYIDRDPATVEKYDRIKNNLEIIVDKSRQGSTGTTYLWCDPPRSALAGQYKGEM